MHAFSFRLLTVVFCIAPLTAHAQFAITPNVPDEGTDVTEEVTEGRAPEAAVEGVPVDVETVTATSVEEEETVTEDGETVKEIRIEKQVRTSEVWSPFIDTRLTFVFADDNLLAGPGETDEPSPGPQFAADDSNNLFFESYDTKDSGFETLSHLVLFKETPTFFQGLTAGAALVLRLQVDPTDRNGGTRIGDSSSYVQLKWRPEGWGDGESVSFTGFPVTSDRFRLGYSYRLTWGGRDIFPGAKRSVPGARVQVTRDNWYAWLGGKSTVLDEVVPLQAEQATEQVANYGALAGFGIDVTPMVRIEAGGGIFTRGTLPGEAVRGEKIQAGGGSVQLAWHMGRDVGTSIDLRVYRNDPLEHQTFFRPVKYDDGTDYVIKTEFTYLVQTLENPESFGSTSLQSAKAGDVNIAVRDGLNRFFIDAEFRDVSFILFNVPSLVPFQDFTEQMKPRPEWFAAVGYDRYFEGLHLTPGLRAGVLAPASVLVERVPAGVEPPDSLTGERTMVIRREGEFDILPIGESVIPVLAVQATARLDISESMAALAEVSFELDSNRATFREDERGETIAVFVDPYVLGFNLVLQARF